MANRVVVNICGDDYTLVAEESPSYMQRVGSYVDGRMRETMDAAKVGRVNAAVLTAVNIADELMKAQETAEQLRGQIKGYADEAAQAHRLVGISKGKIISDGPPNEVFQQVEALKAVGLTVPETVELLYELNREGFDLPLDALSDEDCAQALYQLLS